MAMKKTLLRISVISLTVYSFSNFTHLNSDWMFYRRGPPHPLDSPIQCGENMEACTEIVAFWGVGAVPNCLHEQMGFLVGGTIGLKYAVIEVNGLVSVDRNDRTP